MPALPSLHPYAVPALAALVDSGLALDAYQLARRLATTTPEAGRALVCLEAKGWAALVSGTEQNFPLERQYRFRPEAGLVFDSPCGRRWFFPSSALAEQYGGAASRVAWTDVERDGYLLRAASADQVRRALDAIRAASGMRPHETIKR